MRAKRVDGWWCLTVLVLTCTGCASTSGRATVGDQITNLLDRQAAAWNTGDLEDFMQPYWQSPDLTFSSGGRVTRGWVPTLEGYRKRYPTRESMGHLAFSDLEITELGADAALVLGRWRLDRDDPVGGTFTLVMRKDEDAGRWVIIHDHPSRDGP